MQTNAGISARAQMRTRKRGLFVNYLSSDFDGGASLGFAVMFQSYYHFSSTVAFFQIPDSLGDLTQPATPVDDRCYLCHLHGIAHDGQVLFVQSRQKPDHVLAYEA